MMTDSSRHVARKRFGQNFLVDNTVVNQIVLSIGVRENDHLVEIGPGKGALTKLLVEQSRPVDVIELDRDLVPLLQRQFSQEEIIVHNHDALQFDYSVLRRDQGLLRVVGNLPYNISTPLLFHLLHYRRIIDDMHFMLQQEVVDRLAAEPGSKAWGRLGIMAQYYCEVEKLFTVPPEAFDPRPKVQSAIVRLKPLATPVQQAKDIKFFEKAVKLAFSQRRKTLRNNFRNVLGVEDLGALDLDPGERPENLSLSAFIKLGDALYTKITGAND
jgi:16S rRNA (adenine1518-N6/adenine1519-N6)-dimethyltransferase